MIKIIVADPHLQTSAILQSDAVIDPQTIEDWDSGEHTLSLGYPLTGPTVERSVKLTWRQIFYPNKTWREVLEDEQP